MKFQHISTHPLLILISIILLNISSSNSTTNKQSKHWVLKINTDDINEATEIAKEHNFRLIRQVGSLKGHFIVESNHHRISKRSTNTVDKSALELTSHPLVESFAKEDVLVRKKRDFIELPIRPVISNLNFRQNRQVSSFNPNEDPFWREMWYLNRHNSNKNMPDMNITGAWAQGYSGRGVSVTFLDDGLEHDHPDLKQNYNPRASTDINNHDDDPMPRYDDTNENKHGTRCAGEVAAVANNSICSVGIAFNSGIGGIRMLDGDVTDSVEASSLSFNPQDVHIYSASWGPDDNGEVVDGPGPMARKAFVDGVNTGRKGLGSIYVWASGNGGRFNDSCACDGYANSIYTLSISSTSENSEKPWYLEECASTLATTYSSGDERNGEKEIITTDIRHKCTSKHTGTSAAAPIAAGIIALALEANPNLTWRDIMFITVLTSRARAIKSNNYVINKRGLMVSSRYGFGLMDAGRMVKVAKDWKTVPKLVTCSIQNSNYKVKTIQKAHSIEAVLTTDACQDNINEVNYVEQVEIIVSVRAGVRGLLEIFLTSPMGTKSQILPRRARDSSPDGFKRWSFMSVQSWGEFSKGDWTLSVSSSDGSLVQLDDYEVVIHGTKTRPVDYEAFVSSDELNCNIECSPLGNPCGPTAYDCQICSHFRLETGHNIFKCVTLCPSGYFADFSEKKCIKCDSTCSECSGPSKFNCTTCPNDSHLTIGTNQCLSTCPEGYFINSNQKCEECDSSCLTCEHESKYCLSCKNLKDYDISIGDYDAELVLKHNYCVVNIKENECESGSYYDVTLMRCNFCDITCKECSSNLEDACTSCPSSRRGYLNSGRCVHECDNGFYLNETLGHCFKCNSNCKNCSKNKNECLVCEEGFTLDENNQCVQTLFFDNDCSDTNCYECFGKNKNQCLICKNGFSVFNGECVQKAPDGYFKKSYEDNRGIIYKIEKCNGNGQCAKCNKDSECLKCNDGFHLIGTVCYANCDQGSYPTSDGLCNKCESPCDKCFNKTQCLSCVSNKILFDGKCLDSCPISYYAQNSTCVLCHASCETCTGSDKSNCIACSEGFRYEDKECKSQCPDGTFYDYLQSECSLCNSSSCSWCVKTSNTCTKCASPFALDASTSTCRPCCSRSLRGKIKHSSCCNCPQVYTGFCSIEPEEDNIFYNVFHVHKNSALKTIFSIFVLIVAFVLVIYSILMLKRNLNLNSKNFGNVEYSVLEDS